MKKNKIGIGIIAIVVLGLLIVGLSANASASGEKAISISGSNLGSGDYHSNVAAEYFTAWGYDTWKAYTPSEAEYEAHIKDNAVKYCFAWAHGATGGFENAEGEWISVHEIIAWMSNRDKMTFAFLGHCHGMDSTGPLTLSHAYRKGSTVNTVTIGYKNVQGVSYCSLTKWRIALFDKADTGVTWKEAFDYARASYPHCVQYTEFVGDERLTVRGICGDVNNDGYVRTSDGRAIFRYLTYGEPLDNMWAADVNGDGEIRTSDGRAIFRHLTYGEPLNCRCC